jgi:PTH1 family peptidyl-tRNA hydrolase
LLLIVGLGNPGRAYASHRHNVGFMVVDALARRAGALPGAFKEEFSGSCARVRLGDEQAILLQPMTFMNESGRSVQAAMSFFKIEPTELTVVHDELDLPFGTVRLKHGGGHAGHNGLRSIMAHVGTGDFVRVRMGIGRPPAGREPRDWVLSSFDAAESAALPDAIGQAVDAILDAVTRGLAPAMNKLNTRPKKPPKEEPEA